MKLIVLMAGVLIVISLLVVFLVVPIFAQGSGTPSPSQIPSIICPVTGGGCQGWYQRSVYQGNQTSFGSENIVTW
jgi:hypothetical protein